MNTAVGLRLGAARGRARAEQALSKTPFICAGAAVLGVMAWAAFSGAPSQERRYLYDTPTPAAEAAYCLAVAQRVGEITHGLGERRLEWFLREQTEYWVARVTRNGADRVSVQGSSAMANVFSDGRARLMRDTQARDVNEQAHLHLALQRCGERSLAQGARVRSME